MDIRSCSWKCSWSLHIYVQQAERRIKVEYATRMVEEECGIRVHTYQSKSTTRHPYNLCMGIISIPEAIAQITHEGSQSIQHEQSVDDNLYAVTSSFPPLLQRCCHDPKDMADNIKRYGGFIPGIRR